MQKEITLLFNTLYKTVLQNAQIEIPELCNNITIINIGTTQAVIDSALPLNAGVPGTNNGESFTYGGNKGEMFYGRLNVAFPAGGVGNVLIIFKIYLPNQQALQ